MAAPGFSVTAEQEGDRLVVRVSGEIDLATGPAVWTVIEDRLEDGNDLVLDLASTTFMDSTGLGLIIRASGIYGPEKVSVRSPQPRVLALFDLTGMRRHITVVEADDLA